MRTLVTGGAGFVGAHLVRALLDRGDDVVVLDRLEEQVHNNGYSPPEGVTFIRGGVGNPELADQALAGVDRVVHLAAAVGVGQSMYEISRYVNVNSYETAVFLERLALAASRPERLVVASSMSIYGEGQYACREHGIQAPPPRPEAQLGRGEWECRCPVCGAELEPLPTSEDKPLNPTSVYAITKRDHEELALVVGAAYGVPTTALRFFNVYGSGQALSNPYTGVAAIFSSRLLNGRRPLVFEDGRQSRDFIHVADLVRGILLALERDEAAGHVVNLGTGRAITIADMAVLLAERLGSDLEPEFPGRFRAGDIRHCFADGAKAKSLLGFEAAIRLEDGVDELVEWVASQDAEDGVDRALEELAARGLAR
jgi:dTDP-L-rhamnose 4-epimerase